MANLLFDYDGTLHDCIKIYAPAFRMAYDTLVARGHAPARAWTDSEISPWLGYSARDMWHSFAPELPQREQDRCSRLIGAEMLRLVKAGQARLYQNIPSVLERLKGQKHQLIFLSNCKRQYLEAHRAQFHLDRYFSAFYCAEDYSWQPKTALFPVIRQAFPGQFVVIGDRFHDMEVAQRYGLQSIGCAYGYGTAEELQSARAIVQKPEELPARLLSLLD